MMAIITERAEDGWGTAAIAELVSPSTAGNARFLAFWRRYERASASPNAAATMIRWNLAIDVRAALPAISCPTLVIHRKDIRLVSAAAARHVAGQIPGSRYRGCDATGRSGRAPALQRAVPSFSVTLCGRARHHLTCANRCSGWLTNRAQATRRRCRSG
jgi:hypothetical protein